VRHHTFSGILNRHNPERHSPLAHLLKHFTDTGSGEQCYCGTKFFSRSKVRIGSFRAEEGNLKRRFNGAASRDNFSGLGSSEKDAEGLASPYGEHKLLDCFGSCYGQFFAQGRHDRLAGQRLFHQFDRFFCGEHRPTHYDSKTTSLGRAPGAQTLLRNTGVTYLNS
jgi:hypothetical protein